MSEKRYTILLPPAENSTQPHVPLTLKGHSIASGGDKPGVTVYEQDGSTVVGTFPDAIGGYEAEAKVGH
jgi:hypothetical protein